MEGTFEVKGIRRVNFFAGPGAGKTTVASKVFGELSSRGHDVEHVAEYVKQWAHEGRFPESHDQTYIFGKQLHFEDVALRHVRTIVTDCPLLMCATYAKFYGYRGYVELRELAKFFDEDFLPLNFLIERTVEYKDKGRYQSLEDAKRFDLEMKMMMDAHLKDGYITVTVDKLPRIIQIIEEQLT